MATETKTINSDSYIKLTTSKTLNSDMYITVHKELPHGFQRSMWYDGTRYWRSSYDFVNSRIIFEYTTDKENWTENVSARLTVNAYNADFIPNMNWADYSIEHKTGYLFIVYKNGADIEARIATGYPAVDFAFGAATTVFDGSADNGVYNYANISNRKGSKLAATGVLTITADQGRQVEVKLATAANSIAGWGAATTVSNVDLSKSTYVSLREASDNNEELYVVWNESNTLYGRFYDGSWQTTETITTVCDGIDTNYRNTWALEHITDAKQTQTVVYKDNVNKYICFRINADVSVGDNWDAEIQVSTSTGFIYPCIAESGIDIGCMYIGVLDGQHPDRHVDIFHACSPYDTWHQHEYLGHNATCLTIIDESPDGIAFTYFCQTDKVIETVFFTAAWSITSDIQVGYLGVTKTLTSDSYIKESSTATINSDSFIKKLGSTGTIGSDSYILEASTATINSDDYIKKLATAKTLTSDSYIKEGSTSTITSDAYILKPGDEGTITSDMQVGHLGISKTISSDNYLKRTYGGQQTSTHYSDMISLYHMNEPVWAGAAGEVIDSKGSNNGYAIGDTVTIEAGHLFGTYCGDFSGNDVGLNLGSNSSFHVAQPSIAIWFYPTSHSEDFNDLVNSGRYYLTIRSTGKIEFYAYIGSWITAISDSAITLNKWHLAVATYDGSNAKLYIDGVLQATQGAGTGSVTWASNTIYIGQNGGSSHEFRGKLDELSFYNVAISQDRITELFKENTMLFSDLYIKNLASSATLTSDNYIKHTLPQYFNAYYDHGQYDLSYYDTVDSEDRFERTSDSYINNPISETLASDSYIKEASSKTLDSNTYISKSSSKTLTSDAYILKPGDEGTIVSDMQIGWEGLTGTLVSDSYIKEASSKTLTSDSYVKKLATEKTLDSDSYIKKSSSKTLTSDYYIKEASTVTISSDSYILLSGTATLASDAYIEKVPTGSLTSDMQVGHLGVSKTITSDSYLMATPTKTLTSDMYIKKLGTSKTIISDSYINKPVSETLDSDSHIKKSITSTITNDSHLALEGFWSEEWEVEFVSPVSESITADFYINKPTTEILYSDMYITKESDGAISSDSYILKSSTNNINTNYCIRRSDGTKPWVCEARYVNKPVMCEAVYINKPIIVSANSLSYNETMVATPTVIAHSKTIYSNAYITI